MEKSQNEAVQSDESIDLNDNNYDKFDLSAIDSFSDILNLPGAGDATKSDFKGLYYYRKEPRRVSTAPDFAASRHKSSLADLPSLQKKAKRRLSASSVPAGSSSLASSSSVSTSTTGLAHKRTKRGSAISIGTQRRVPIKPIDRPPTVPDGGYGWVIVFAAFSLQVAFGGFLFSFGLYFVTFLEVFQEDRSTTAWIGSSLNGGFAFIAPMSSMLAKYFGCRKVILIGYALLAVCIFASTFSPNIYTLIVLMGAMGGVCLGIFYLPTIVIVGTYFEARRSLAIAICTSGTGVGGIVFPVIIEQLIELYGWKGSLWIMSGLMVQCLAFAALLRPLTQADMKECANKWKREKTKANEATNKQKCEINMAFDAVDLDENLKEVNGGQKLTKDNSNNNDTVDDGAQIKNGEYTITEVENEGNTETVITDKLQRKKRKAIEATDEQKCEVNMAFDAEDLDDNLKEVNGGRKLAKDNSNNNDTVDDGAPIENGEYTISEVENEGNTEIVITEDDHRSCFHKGWEAFRSYADIWLLENPIFLLYTTSFTLATIGVRVATVFIPDYASVIGIPLEGISFLLSLTGIFNTVSKIIAGYISDKPRVDPLILYSVFIMVGGVAAMVVPEMSVFNHLIAFTVVSGTNIGAISLLNSVVVVDLIGMEKMSAGLSLIMMISGFAALFAVPFAGWLFDVTGSYYGTFYLSGSCSLLAGLLCLPLRHIARCIYGTGDSQTTETI